MNYIILNGRNSREIQGLLIQELPPISKPLMRTQIEEIDGRDGDIVTKLGYSAYDKELTIGLHGNFDINAVIAFFDSEGTVIFSNEPDKYYRYQVIDQIDFERLVRYRTATVTMHCQPFKLSATEETIEEEGEETITTDLLTFESVSTDPLVDLAVALEPIQNLNGYDHPWVGGAGVNKLPHNSSGTGTITRSGITVAVNNGVFTISGTATAGDGINYPLVQSVDLSPSTNKIAFLNSVAGGTLTVAFKRGNTTVHFWTMTPVNRVASGWTDSGNEVIDTVSIQWTSSLSVSGSMKVSPMLIALTETNPTAYIPYENICPIYPNNGKNLISPNLTFREGYIRGNDGTETASSASHYSSSIAVYPSTTYTITNIIDSIALVVARIYFLQSNGTWISRTEQYTYNSTNAYTFDTPSNCGQIQIQCGNGIDMTKVQLEVGKYATPYVPYNAIGITRTGKNLFDKNAVAVGVYLDTVTGLPVSASAYSVTDFIPVEEGVSVFIPASQSTRRWFYTKDRTPKTFLNNSHNQVYTPTEDGYIRVSISHNAISLDTYQIEYGTGATQYEPYTAERYYPISDNPVYGGTLDVTTGVLTVNKMCIDLANYKTNWTKSSSYSGGFYKTATNFGFESRTPFICTHAKYVNYLGEYVKGTCYCDNSVNIRIMPDDATVQDWYDYIQAQHDAGTPIMVCGQLQTPQTYQLTPTEVTALLGINNVWADAGKITVVVPNLITITNSGNTIAKPTMTIYGSGNVNVYLNGRQIFQIAMGDIESITIDAEAMEASQGGILRNRLVVGDYANFVLETGDNTLALTGNVTSVEISNYSRWI